MKKMVAAYSLTERWQTLRPVSYTHLDVYKRQESDRLDVFGKVVGKINSNDVPDYRF